MSQHALTDARLQHLSAAFTAIPFNHMLGLQLDHIDAESVTMSFAMKHELIGNFLQGILHGGVISSVLDMAGGMIVMAAMISEHPEMDNEDLSNLVAKCSTVDLQVNYLRPGKGERYVAKAFLIKKGNTISFTRMELLNQDGLLIATGNGTYLLRS